MIAPHSARNQTFFHSLNSKAFSLKVNNKIKRHRNFHVCFIKYTPLLYFFLSRGPSPSFLALCGASVRQGISFPALCPRAHIRRFFIFLRRCLPCHPPCHASSLRHSSHCAAHQCVKESHFRPCALGHTYAASLFLSRGLPSLRHVLRA